MSGILRNYWERKKELKIEITIYHCINTWIYTLNTLYSSRRLKKQLLEAEKIPRMEIKMGAVGGSGWKRRQICSFTNDI